LTSQPDLDLVGAGALDLGLGDAELVDALADDVHGAVERVLRHLGLLRRGLALVDELDAALEVEALLGGLGHDDHEGRDQQAQDHQQDEAVASAVGHPKG